MPIDSNAQTSELPPSNSNDTVSNVNDSDEVTRENVVPPTEPETSNKPQPKRKRLDPTVVKFTTKERSTVLKVCEQIRLTPRSVKRLTNVLKLLKIYWHQAPNSIDPTRDQLVLQVVVALLALSSRHPDLMQDFLWELDLRGVYEYNNPDVESQPIAELAQRFVTHRQNGGDSELTLFLHECKQLIPSQLPIKQVGLDNLRLIRTFCFVGDNETNAYSPELLM